VLLTPKKQLIKVLPKPGQEVQRGHTSIIIARCFLIPVPAIRGLFIHPVLIIQSLSRPSGKKPSPYKKKTKCHKYTPGMITGGFVQHHTYPLQGYTMRKTFLWTGVGYRVLK
jgi:hypothetical protein